MRAGSLSPLSTTTGSVTIPVFWDPTYLQKKKKMIAALGAHFTDYPSPQNRTVKIISASFANATSEDWSVPHNTAETQAWHDAEYTTEKLVDAGQQILDATMAAFPNQEVTLAIAGDGQLDATPTRGRRDHDRDDAREVAGPVDRAD